MRHTEANQRNGGCIIEENIRDTTTKEVPSKEDDGRVWKRSRGKNIGPRGQNNTNINQQMQLEDKEK